MISVILTGSVSAPGERRTEITVETGHDERETLLGRVVRVGLDFLRSLAVERGDRAAHRVEIHRGAFLRSDVRATVLSGPTSLALLRGEGEILVELEPANRLRARDLVRHFVFSFCQLSC